MTLRKREFVTFYSPGTMFAEATTRPIDVRDTRLATRMAAEIVERYNAKPYGFKFETRIVADPVPDGQGGKLKVEEKVIDETGIHFINGTLATLDEVEARNDPKEDMLRLNMRSFPIVCMTVNSYRSTNPFDEKDVLVSADGEILERGDDPKWVAYRAKKKADNEALFEAIFRSKTVKIEVET